MEPQQQTQSENSQTETKKTIKISTPAAIITAGAIIAVALIFSGKTGVVNKPKLAEQKQIPPTTEPSSKVSLRSEDFVLGDISNAQIVIVEYSDSDCPFCQKFHETMKTVIKNNKGKVAWVYRYFPLSIHANAGNEAAALDCAGSLGGNDVYWKYMDQIIGITATPETSKPILTSFATNLGVDEKLFEACTKNPATAKKIADQSAEAQALGAQGTPYSVAINKSGKQVAIPGAYPIEEVQKIIDGLLK